MSAVYGKLRNPSSKYTMIATLRIPGLEARVHCLPPGEFMAVHAEAQHEHDDGVVYPLWTLEWESSPKKRKGLMRFSR